MEQRRRAPLRQGQRTTLRVPHALLRSASELADELGTTPNDAIVRLAEEGVAARGRRREAERVAAQRRDAVVGGLADASGFPSPEELRSAMLSGRRDP